MKIATFNANSIRARLPIVLMWLKEHQPDLLAVQETKVQDPDFPVEPFREIDYYVVFKGQKSYNGVAILSREPLQNVTIGFEDDPDSGPRLIRGDYKGIHIINSYVPQGRDRESEFYQYKLDWFNRVHKLLKESFTPDQNIIWLGDLNVAPEPMDVHDPKSLNGHVCFNEDLTKLFYGICEWGLHDVFRKHHPEPGQFSYFDYRVRGAVSRKVGWRIDHILATMPVYNRSIDSWIDVEPRKLKDPKPSDHTFMVAEFSE